MLTLQVQVSYNKESFDGRAKLTDGRANALPCPPLATPMNSTNHLVLSTIHILEMLIAEDGE